MRKPLNVHVLTDTVFLSSDDVLIAEIPMHLWDSIVEYVNLVRRGDHVPGKTLIGDPLPPIDWNEKPQL